MENRDQRIREEVSGLWRELYDEPPPPNASGRELLDTLMSRLGHATYERLRSPHLRAGTIAGPGQPGNRNSLR
jgi:hypothetical protein